jgi:predicted short-subunit dehydrogenase-like oxidoreductase (DUF2520 family)
LDAEDQTARGGDAAHERTVALVGPGRAGTTIALALYERGYRVVGVAGRAPDAASTRDAAAGLGAPAVLVSRAGTGAGLVIVATPDAALDSTVRAVTPSLEPGALVVHLAGSRGLDVFADLAVVRPDVRVGALHPLQSFPSASLGLDRLAGSWAAVAGDPRVRALAIELGLEPFELDDAQRGRYHAAAAVASNHLVALLGQVERLAAACDVPFQAFAPLAIASLENAFAMGPAGALTGPVARGDLRTVERHLAEMPPGERDAYRSLAREAARLAGRRHDALERLLDDLRSVPATRDRLADDAPDDPQDEV